MKSSGFVQNESTTECANFPHGRLPVVVIGASTLKIGAFFSAKHSAGRGPEVKVVLRESGHVDCVLSGTDYQWKCEGEEWVGGAFHGLLHLGCGFLHPYDFRGENSATKSGLGLLRLKKRLTLLGLQEVTFKPHLSNHWVSVCPEFSHPKVNKLSSDFCKSTFKFWHALENKIKQNIDIQKPVFDNRTADPTTRRKKSRLGLLGLKKLHSLSNPGPRVLDCQPRCRQQKMFANAKNTGKKKHICMYL